MDSVFRLGLGDAGKEKVNIDELYESDKQRALRTLHMFNRVLKRIHSRIRHTSRARKNEQHCWYVVPEMIIGYPSYDCRDCTAYVINALRENGFVVRYTHPNLLFISWQSWTPAYVREEIRKKTGMSVGPRGEIQDLVARKQRPLKLNTKGTRTVAFKDIDNYRPTGKMFKPP